MKTFKLLMKNKLAVSVMLIGLMGLLLPQAANASHLMGGEITVSWVSGNTYKIKQKIYRDCAGIALGTTTAVSVTPTIGTINLNLTAVIDRSILCPGQTSTCNGGTAPGIEEHDYEATVTMANNTTYVITSDLNARNAAITTISNPSSQDMYITTTFKSGNNGAGTPTVNNSPQFLNAPIGQFCIGSLSTLSPGGFDPDGDALVYSLVAPRGASGANLTYLAGFSATNPLTSSTPVTINSSTGEISFTPTVANQVPVICIRVDEFRAGVKIGEIYRDIQIRMINCSGNTPPSIPALANVVVPVGTSYCTPVNVTDANGDLITLTATSGLIPPGTFVIGTSGAGFKNSTFCVTPTAVHQGQTFSVSINALDNHCPASASSVRTFNITVPRVCAVTAHASATAASCGHKDGTATASLTGGTAPYQYSWSGPGGFSASGSDHLTGLAAGTYCVTIVDGNSCVDDECVTVTGGASPVGLTATKADPTCGEDNGTIILTATGGTLPYSYSLNAGTGQPTGLFENLAAGSYTPAVSDFNGCGNAIAPVILLALADVTPPTATCQDLTVELDFYGNVAISESDIDNGSSDNCGGVSLMLSQLYFDCSNVGNNTVTLTVSDATGNISTCDATVSVEDVTDPDVECHDATLTLDINGQATLSTADIFDHDHEACGLSSLTLSQTSFNCSNVGSNTVTLTAIDNSGNPSSCTATVVVSNVYPIVSAPDATGCDGTPIALSGSPAGGTYTVANPYSGPAAPYTYSYTDANGCSNSASGNIHVNPLPVVSAADAVGCAGTSIALSGSPAAGTFNVANPYTGPSTSYTYTFTDANTCTNTATANILVNPLPTVSAPDASGCTGNSITLSGTPTGGTYSVSNPYTGGSTSYSYTYTDANTCTNTATGNITVNPLPVVSAPNASGCTGTSITLSGSPAGGTYSVPNPYVGGSTSYSYTYTDANTCTNTATGNITVNPLPVVSAPNASGCTGTSITLSGSPAGGTYNVSNPYTGGSTSYSYTFTDANTCTNTATGNITVNPLPSVGAANVSGCAGTAIALSGTPAGGTFSKPNPYTGPATTYTYTYTNGNNCTNSATASITVNPNPTVNAGIDEQTFFGYTGDQTVTHTAAASGGTGAYSFAWSLSRPLACNSVTGDGDEAFSAGTCTNNTCGAGLFTPGAPSCSGSAIVTTTLLSDADACVLVTDSKGCKASDCFHIYSEDARCFAGGSTNPKVIICHKTGSTSNPWVQICIAQSAVPAHLAVNMGDYVGKCVSGAHKEDDGDAQLGITNTDAISALKAYPNPFNDKLNIEFTLAEDSKVKLEVFNVEGQLLGVLFEGDVKAAELHKAEFNALGIAKGMVVYRLQTAEKTFYGRAMLMK
jgi:hypothetical protein